MTLSMKILFRGLLTRFLYRFQVAVENIHSEIYYKLIDSYIQDDQEKHFFFNAVKNIPSINKRAEWA